MQIDPRERTANIIGTTIGGMVAFFIGGVLGTVVILTLDAYILAFVLAGGTGGLLLGLLRWKIRKVAKLTLGGVVAVPVGFFLGFGSSGAIFSIPAIHGLFASPHTPDVISIVFSGVLCGAIYGAILYGRRAVGWFAAFSGAAAVPFGLIVAGLNGATALKAWIFDLVPWPWIESLDLNFLAILAGLGTGIGLSIGSYGLIAGKNRPGADL